MTGREIASLLGMLLALAGILVLAYYITRLMAKGSLGGNAFLRRHMGTSQHLEVLERVPLGREQYLAVVRLDEHCFLLSVAGTSVSTLYELTAEEAEKWIKERREAQSVPPTPFYETLKDAISHIKK